MCFVGSSTVSNIALRSRMSLVWEAVCRPGWGGQGLYGNSALSAPFGCEPETALKDKVYSFKKMC